jgi:hypothetical protein
MHTRLSGCLSLPNIHSVLLPKKSKKEDASASV